MKNLLVITLFFCSFGYSSFEISEIRCVYAGKFSSTWLGDIVSLRIDEKRQVLRVNMLPEMPVKLEDGKFEVEFVDIQKIRGKDVALNYKFNFFNMNLIIYQDNLDGIGYKCRLI